MLRLHRRGRRESERALPWAALDPEPDPGASAPDYVEPVLGWRSWFAVESDGATCLSSLYLPAVWPSREALRAACIRGRQPPRWLPRHTGKTPHPAPGGDCECGIYALRPERFTLRLASFEDRVRCPVFGRVALWGVVYEHENGWRASRAYPEHLYVPKLPGERSTAEDTADRLGHYGVEVDVLATSTFSPDLVD